MSGVKQTHCKQGHELTQGNVYEYPSGKRECRICRHTTSRASRLANPDYARFHVRNWQLNNSDKKRAIERVASSKWQKANPEKVRANCRRYKARKRSQLGWLPENYEYLLWLFQDGLCGYCTEPLTIYHLEHKTPLSRGGLHAWENVCLSCQPCNSRKQTKTLDEFLAA